MKKISIYISFIALVASLFACGGYRAAEPMAFFGTSQEEMKALSSGNKYLLIQNNQIRFFDPNNAQSLSLSEALPIKENFSKITGNEDTLFLQIDKEIAFYQLLTKNNNYWEKVASISASSNCDIFEKVGKNLIVASGNLECKTDSTRGSLMVYSLAKLNTPSLVTNELVVNPKDMLVYNNNYILIAQGSFGLKVFQLIDNKLNTIKEYPAIKADKLNIDSQRKLLVVSGNNGISQYDLSDLQNIKFLSSVR